MSSQCEQLKQEYESIKTLKQEFALEYQKAVETGDLTRAKKLKAELEQKRNALAEKLLSFKWERYNRRCLKTVEDKKKYQAKETLAGHAERVYTLQVLPDGRIVSGSYDQTIKIWDGEKKK